MLSLYITYCFLCLKAIIHGKEGVKNVEVLLRISEGMGALVHVFDRTGWGMGRSLDYLAVELVGIK